MRTAIAAAAGLLLLASAVDAVAATATVTRAWQFKDADPAALRLDNLVGDLRIERGSAAGIHVSVKVTAEAGSEAEARAIAEAVEFQTRDAGASSSFAVRLPEARFPMIYHASAPEGWPAGRMYVDYLGERRRLTGDADEGVKLRVDILLRAPEGAKIDARNVLGNSVAEGVVGELRLDGAMGSQVSRNGSGRLELDTGSGAVEVAVHSGEVSADTGSGSVTIRDCQCRIEADTGSGGVSVHGGEGALTADTGSGSVLVEDFKGSIRADTGSGGVTVRGSSGATEFVADTGSGGVRLEGDLSSLQKLDIDTGSGGVTVLASAWPAMQLVVDTGSGSIAVDVAGAEVTREDNDRQVLRVGEGGFRGVIDTGSGSVKLQTR